MTELNIVVLVIGSLVLLLGLVSSLFKRWGLPEPLIALLLGVLLGPVGANLLHPVQWGDQRVILEETARLTLAVGLMGVALRLPTGYPWRQWRTLALLLAVIMPLMWFSSSLLVYWLLDVSLWVALLAGAVITPTDPVVAASIVTGKVAENNLPERLRNLITGESGLNDGLAYPFVLLPILVLTRPEGEVLQHWLTRTWLWEVGGAILMGALIGYAAGRALEWAEEREFIETPSMLAYTIALALLTLGAVKLAGSDGILGVFIAGLAFDHAVKAGQRVREERVVEGVDRFFTLPIFTLLGLTLPWTEWFELGWAALLLVGAVLLLRRLPALLLTMRWMPALKSRADGLFVGWFGPIGVAAIFYGTYAEGHAHVEEPWIVASLIATASIVVHGFTATHFSRLYGSRAAVQDDGENEQTNGATSHE
jgi:NhaP-type Na+/H+ or K+/H+ antiporter